MRDKCILNVHCAVRMIILNLTNLTVKFHIFLWLRVQELVTWCASHQTGKITRQGLPREVKSYDVNWYTLIVRQGHQWEYARVGDNVWESHSLHQFIKMAWKIFMSKDQHISSKFNFDPWKIVSRTFQNSFVKYLSVLASTHHHS